MVNAAAVTVSKFRGSLGDHVKIDSDPETQSSYYEFVREEIAPFLPERLERVLEVGCGAGGTLRWIKQRFPSARTIGIEINSSLANALSANVDEVHIVDGGIPPSGIELVDVILFLDVLEHFADPSAVLLQYIQLLKTGGTVIISMPNVAHYSISFPLLFRRKFDYQEAGIMDRTHLHFFTDRSMVEMLNSVGLRVSEAIMNGPSDGRTKVFNRLTLGRFCHYLTKQYVMRCEVMNGQPEIRWRG